MEMDTSIRKEQVRKLPQANMAHAETDISFAGIWTQLLLAYGVHKSLIFFRIPLTAAVTPKVVKTLQSWGWNIGYKKARTVR